ncbi:DUF4286 family protein [Nocardia jiangxiensis]|uniref:DUF4286 family protein n=1 Tax=Nocardia jiangxiensis TaxID=282685 RepID=UPI0005930821|nr:DUF4286 family protein [Nocardia jiangxiensis]
MSEGSQSRREVLLALTNPVEGKDEEFREWYWGTHIPEILQLPGFVAARRYRAGDTATVGVPYRYATIYEVEGSAEAAHGTLFTAGLSSSDALDTSTVVMLPLASMPFTQWSYSVVPWAGYLVLTRVFPPEVVDEVLGTLTASPPSMWTRAAAGPPPDARHLLRGVRALW